MLGCCLAIACRVGSEPTVDSSSFLRKPLQERFVWIFRDYEAWPGSAGPSEIFSKVFVLQRWFWSIVTRGDIPLTLGTLAKWACQKSQAMLIMAGGAKTP